MRSTLGCKNFHFGRDAHVYVTVIGTSLGGCKELWELKEGVPSSLRIGGSTENVFKRGTKTQTNKHVSVHPSEKWEQLRKEGYQDQYLAVTLQL